MGKKVLFQSENLAIINEDIFSTRAIPSQEIDLVITSPPYNVDIRYNSHNDQLTYEDYLIFSKRWMKRCYRWLRKDRPVLPQHPS